MPNGVVTPDHTGSDHPGRISRGDAVGGNLAGHDRAQPDHRIVADAGAFQN